MIAAALRMLLPQLARRVGFRGAALLFFAQLDLIVAWSLADPSSRLRLEAAPAYRIVNHLDLRVWAGLWALVGIVCLVQSFRRADRLGFAAAIGLKLAWSLALLAARAGGIRGLLGGWVWLTLAAFVAIIGAWPEPVRLEDHQDA